MIVESTPALETVASDLELRLIDYALTLDYADLSERAIHQAKRRVVDTIAGAVASYTAPTSRIARKFAVPVAGGPSARVFGSLVATTPEMAAFANGTMVRFLDINDTYRTTDGSHPSDNLSGVLAVAEMLGLGGQDFLLGLVISYEIQSRFVDAVPFNDAGWDQPVPGAMACALAAGRLMGLSRSAMRDALALSIIPNLCTYQTRAGELSMWKGCAAANGARQGVFAARLAVEGMTGPYDAFDGIFGLWNQTVDVPREFPPLATGDNTFAVQQSNIKMFPVRDSCQLPANTALDLRTKVAASDIRALEIITYKSAHKGAVADPELWAPKSRETADHSMLVTIACALIDGDVTPETFSEGRFLDRDILDLIGRTSVAISDEFSSQTPAVRQCRLEATDAEGHVHVAHHTLTLADIEAGPSDEALSQKFHQLNRHMMPERNLAALLEALWAIDRCENVSEILDLTRI